jgi:hypothetical protein
MPPAQGLKAVPAGLISARLKPCPDTNLISNCTATQKILALTGGPFKACPELVEKPALRLEWGYFNLPNPVIPTEADRRASDDSRSGGTLCFLEWGKQGKTENDQLLTRNNR